MQNQRPVQKLSIVVPVYNEEENITPLVKEIHAALVSLNLPYEIWFVDDGSTDLSLQCIKQVAEQDPQVGYVSFIENAGQSAAFWAGFRAATGDTIITMDADLQNDPADIPALLGYYQQGYDMVIGWRVDRQDSQGRKVASRIGNAFRNALTHETVHDTGCSLKIMRASMAKNMPMFKGMHRFLTTLMRMEGAHVAEVPVNHRARRFGVSKYGTFSRGIAAFQDLLAVNWMLRRKKLPQIQIQKSPE